CCTDIRSLSADMTNLRSLPILNCQSPIAGERYPCVQLTIDNRQLAIIWLFLCFPRALQPEGNAPRPLQVDHARHLEEIVHRGSNQCAHQPATRVQLQHVDEE